MYFSCKLTYQSLLNVAQTDLMCVKLDLLSVEVDSEASKMLSKFSEWPENYNHHMTRMYDWVVETKGYRPLVIDADDLQRDPGELEIAVHYLSLRVRT